jgi:hypothetical protein
MWRSSIGRWIPSSMARSDRSFPMRYRQITFEQDPEVVIGIPIWSPVEDWTVFVQHKGGDYRRMADQARTGPGAGLVPEGRGAYWSRDGRWV